MSPYFLTTEGSGTYGKGLLSLKDIFTDLFFLTLFFRSLIYLKGSRHIKQVLMATSDATLHREVGRLSHAHFGVLTSTLMSILVYLSQN